MFPRVIAEIISDYTAKYELIPLALQHQDEMEFKFFSQNSRAYDYVNDYMHKWLNDNPDKSICEEPNLDWDELMTNPGMGELWEQYPEMIRYDLLGYVNEKWAVRLLKYGWGSINDLSDNGWRILSSNPLFIKYITANLDYIHWEAVSRNQAALDLFKKYPDKIDWFNMSAQPWAINLLEKNLDKVNWDRLSFNSAASDILRKNLDKVNWEFANRGGLIDLLKDHPDKIDWYLLVSSSNPDIVPFVRQHLADIINIESIWCNISGNPLLIDLVSENIDKADWDEIFENESGGKILMLYPDNIQWNTASMLPEIFEPVRSIELVNLLSL